ncbi:hypothetical protein HALLA_14110 [Halostagnicola larsenii XH-48]|uniref:Uncharacterized protein n=1 Tax=Halostagnicola larsenii XH-48 TaxID=797299 RepID=W0JQN6_9EURY|nr:hypothetical protein [Halostagnicola larsenii]AHG01046.1 hypothetical protein HALLA_14110 [Halostagnicola larsenii XH-48]
MSRSTTAPLDGCRIDRIETDDGDSERVDFSGMAADSSEATGSTSRIDAPGAIGGR